MKHKNRIAALMLSLTLCIGAFAVPVFALSEEDGSVVEETVETEEVEETADESTEEPTQEAEPEEAPVEDAAPEPEPETEPETVAAEPSANGLTPEGNLTLVDDYGSADGQGKQFITLVTKSGNYFYLIIDRDSDGNQTVHFLNQVDEADLLALMDDDTAEAYGNHAAEIPAPTPEETPEEPEPSTTPTPTAEASAETPNALPSLILLGALAVGGVGFAVTKFRHKKTAQQVRPDPDADYEVEGGYAFPEEDVDDV